MTTTMAKDRATSFTTTTMTTTTTKANDCKDDIFIGDNTGAMPVSATARFWHWRQHDAGKDASAMPAEMPALHQGTAMKPWVTTRKMATTSCTPTYCD